MKLALATSTDEQSTSLQTGRSYDVQYVYMSDNQSETTAVSQQIAVRNMNSLRRRLERLARYLLTARFTSLDELWRFETGLLQLQRDIQKEITHAKRRMRIDRSEVGLLSHLRMIRWQSRLLGDAFAWSLMRLNRKVIYPLASNERNGGIEDGHGSRGMLAIAEHLASIGLGFPILHDITDVLRIGDITFVRFTDDNWNSRTVEIKTHPQAEYREDASDTMTYEYRIEVVTYDPFDPVTGVNISPHPVTDATTRLPRRETSPRPIMRRAERQYQRMSLAHRYQTAPDDELIEKIGERPYLSTTSYTGAPAHWKSLRRIIRDARINGHASEVIGQTFLYGAFYSDTGLDDEIIKTMTPPIEAIKSLVAHDERHPDLLIVNAIPPKETSQANLFLPFFLYQIPRRAIADIIHNRLIIYIFVSMAKIAQAFERAGFKVHTNTDRSMEIVSFVRDPDGLQYKIQLPIFATHINEMIYEFRDAGYLIGIARDTMEAIVKSVIPTMSGKSD